jgi:hypothetical protein
MELEKPKNQLSLILPGERAYHCSAALRHHQEDGQGSNCIRPIAFSRPTLGRLRESIH